MTWQNIDPTNFVVWVVCFPSFFLCFMSCFPIKMLFQNKMIGIWEQGLLMSCCLLLNNYCDIPLELGCGFCKFFCLLLPSVSEKLWVNPRLLRWGLCLGQPNLTSSLLLKGVVPPLHLRWLTQVLEKQSSKWRKLRWNGSCSVNKYGSGCEMRVRNG